ncbi:hypothetical protein [Solirhodobacter olei]|uniref:hypothetical protein n=1 Tax=Solirhodobacter olei TaxID=2493082 RepID=UPI0013E36D19|nr:hypothetical protein [Solirhodobacter olei]
MDRKNSSPPQRPGGPDSREDRLKAALKANIARRKAQARLRQAGEADKKTGETED